MPSSVEPVPGDWLEVELEAEPDLVSELDVILTRSDLGGWVVEAEEPTLKWVFYLPRESGWQERLGTLGVSLREAGARMAVRRSVADEDWAECWKQFYHPRRIGKTLLICPSWECYEPAPEEKMLILDPGMAFGTGYHASTALCMELLEEYLLVASAHSVLDVGIGSGILSISALLLGADEVLGVDHDPVAVRVARENLELNALGERAQVRQFEGVPDGTFDLVLANLVAQVLVDLADDLASAVARGGRLVAGGIVGERRDEVVRALQFRGLELEAELEREDWVGLRLRRP
jgi:ribosomal protein L11 methyltransferase